MSHLCLKPVKAPLSLRVTAKVLTVASQAPRDQALSSLSHLFSHFILPPVGALLEGKHASRLLPSHLRTGCSLCLSPQLSAWVTRTSFTVLLTITLLIRPTLITLLITANCLLSHCSPSPPFLPLRFLFAFVLSTF